MPRAVMGVAVPPEVAEQLQAQQMADNAAELAGLQLDNPEVHLPRALLTSAARLLCLSCQACSCCVQMTDA